MAKKSKGGDGDQIVYSTNPQTMADVFQTIQLTNSDEVMAKEEEVRVWIDRKRRGGKKAVVIKGIKGTDRQLTEIAKFLKSNCGVGGSAKNGEIIIQGDQRDKVIGLLQSRGYTNVKPAGG